MGFRYLSALPHVSSHVFHVIRKRSGDPYHPRRLCAAFACRDPSSFGRARGCVRWRPALWRNADATRRRVEMHRLVPGARKVLISCGRWCAWNPVMRGDQPARISGELDQQGSSRCDSGKYSTSLPFGKWAEILVVPGVAGWRYTAQPAEKGSFRIRARRLRFVRGDEAGARGSHSIRPYRQYAYRRE